MQESSGLQFWKPGRRHEEHGYGCHCELVRACGRFLLVTCRVTHSFFGLHEVMMRGVDPASGVIAPQPKLTALTVNLRVRTVGACGRLHVC